MLRAADGKECRSVRRNLALAFALALAAADVQAGQLIVQYQITGGTLGLTVPNEAVTGGSFRIAFPASGPNTISATTYGFGIGLASLQSLRITGAVNRLEINGPAGAFNGAFSLPPIGPILDINLRDTIPDDPALFVRWGPALTNIVQLFTGQLSFSSTLFGPNVSGTADLRFIVPGSDPYVGVDWVGKEISRTFVGPEPTLPLLIGSAFALGAVAIRRSLGPKH
jgi:hypothetical protein